MKALNTTLNVFTFYSEGIKEPKMALKRERQIGKSVHKCLYNIDM